MSYFAAVYLFQQIEKLEERKLPVRAAPNVVNAPFDSIDF
jgi:hypothetical protein